MGEFLCKLKEYRVRAGLTQEELSRAMEAPIEALFLFD